MSLYILPSTEAGIDTPLSVPGGIEKPMLTLNRTKLQAMHNNLVCKLFSMKY